MQWTPSVTLKYPAICFFAGLVAGVFGIGGGAIKGPLMLEMGKIEDSSGGLLMVPHVNVSMRSSGFEGDVCLPSVMQCIPLLAGRKQYLSHWMRLSSLIPVLVIDKSRWHRIVMQDALCLQSRSLGMFQVFHGGGCNICGDDPLDELCSKY